MCPIIPLHKQSLKIRGESQSCFYISVVLVPFICELMHMLDMYCNCYFDNTNVSSCGSCFPCMWIHPLSCVRETKINKI